MDRGPVIISPHNKDWKIMYQEAKVELENHLEDYIETIDHIGSTSVKGLAAKPTIDILIGLKSLNDDKQIIEHMKKLNYQYINKYEDILPFRRYFIKTETGETGHSIHSHHIHMVEKDHEFWKKQIAVRDYLRENEKARNEYASLKVELASRFGEDRESYQEGKASFLDIIEEKAMKKYYND